jgi:signal transduction histidine kinase
MTKRASESIGRELAILAHEIREPLASILFAVAYANETRHDEEASRHLCEIVERQVRYLAGIIDEVLDASRANHGKLLLRKELVDVGDAIDTAMETNGPMLKKRRHSLTVSLPREYVFLMADRLRVQQIVNNLVANAAKYTEPGGHIYVAVETNGDFVIIEVCDTGIGIAADVLPRVFDLFHQGDGRGDDGFSGLGIGLALVKSLVELHGGSITVRSDGVGRGASFVVRLPGRVTVRRENPALVEQAPVLRPICRATEMRPGIDSTDP